MFEGLLNGLFDAALAAKFAAHSTGSRNPFHHYGKSPRRTNVAAMKRAKTKRRNIAMRQAAR
jgi:hypothetical protein